MAHAILKLSYNLIGDKPVEGGICGTAFFIDSVTALTAHHLVNRVTYQPNPGYTGCQYWLVSRTGAIMPFSRMDLVDCPDLDTTVIRFEKPQSVSDVYKLSARKVRVGDPVNSYGYINGMPYVRCGLEVQGLVIGLVIESCDLSGVTADREGSVRSVRRRTINYNDVKMDDVTVIEPSFGAVLGMSGGPLLDTRTKKVIGLMSFGLPQDAPRKDVVYAVAAPEIMSFLKRL